MYVSPLYHLLVIYYLLIYLFIYFLLLSLLLLFICLPLFSLFLCSFFSINCFYLFDFFSSSFLFLFIGFACVSTAIQVLEKRVRIRSYSGPHFPRIFPHSDWIRRDAEYDTYSVRMRENAGKMQTRITPNTDYFYAVLVFN